MFCKRKILKKKSLKKRKKNFKKKSMKKRKKNSLNR